MLNKFKDNFFSLNKILNTDELLDFIVEKKGFDEDFVKMICESDELTKITNVRKNKTKNFKKKNYHFDISKIDNNYEIGYDPKKHKITVDISGNTIFSYYDDEEKLKRKLSKYIDDEEYEKANVLYLYIKKCEII